MRPATPTAERAKRSPGNRVTRTSGPLCTIYTDCVSDFDSSIDSNRVLRLYRELQCYNRLTRLTDHP
jgi:hypothetical protein